MHNADVTRYVTDPVTLPRPDPSRPVPSSTAEAPSIGSAVGADEPTRDGRFAASIGGAS